MFRQNYECWKQHMECLWLNAIKFSQKARQACAHNSLIRYLKLEWAFSTPLFWNVIRTIFWRYFGDNHFYNLLLYLFRRKWFFNQNKWNVTNCAFDLIAAAYSRIQKIYHIHVKGIFFDVNYLTTCQSGAYTTKIADLRFCVFAIGMMDIYEMMLSPLLFIWIVTFKF